MTRREKIRQAQHEILAQTKPLDEPPQKPVPPPPEPPKTPEGYGWGV